MDVLKSEFRKECLMRRDRIPLAEREFQDSQILQELKHLHQVNHFQHYLCYINYKSEVNTQLWIAWLLNQAACVYIPKVQKNQMDFFRIDSLEEVHSGFCGIMEPCTKEDLLFQKVASMLDTVCMIVPGCAFDLHGNRMGYGGGYYDRYLSKWESSYRFYKVALAYEEQIVSQIPVDIYDQKVNVIITKKGCYQCLI